MLSLAELLRHSKLQFTEWLRNGLHLTLELVISLDKGRHANCIIGVTVANKPCNSIVFTLSRFHGCKSIASEYTDGVC